MNIKTICFYCFKFFETLNPNFYINNDNNTNDNNDDDEESTNLLPTTTEVRELENEIITNATTTENEESKIDEMIIEALHNDIDNFCNCTKKITLFLSSKFNKSD